MAIQEDSSAPAAVTSNTSGVTSLTTAQFSPPADSLIVAMASDHAGNSGSVTFSDSTGGGNWTAVTVLTSTGSGTGTSAVGVKYFASPETNMTVTASFVSGHHLVVKVLTGAASDQSGAATATKDITSSTTAFNQSITTTTTGSYVYGQAHTAFSRTFTAISGTTEIHEFDNSFISTASVAFRKTSATTTPGAVTIGETASAASTGGSVVLREVLPAANEATGTFAIAGPAPAVSMAGNLTTEGVLGISGPSPALSMAGEHIIPASGTLGITGPSPSMTVTGSVNPTGPLAVTGPSPAMTFASETQPHGEHVITVAEEDRTYRI